MTWCRIWLQFACSVTLTLLEPEHLLTCSVFDVLRRSAAVTDMLLMNPRIIYFYKLTELLSRRQLKGAPSTPRLINSARR